MNLNDPIEIISLIESEFPLEYRKEIYQAVIERNNLLEELIKDRKKPENFSNSRYIAMRDFVDEELMRISQDFGLECKKISLSAFDFSFLEVNSKSFSFIQKMSHYRKNLHGSKRFDNYSIPISGFFDESESYNKIPLILLYGKDASNIKNPFCEFRIRTLPYKNWLESIVVDARYNHDAVPFKEIITSNRESQFNDLTLKESAKKKKSIINES
jgi:hypothetical protein